MDRITLYEELRLIERSESEVSTAWKGAHLLLFFLAFVFGSFCTFCFHMLMYLFDEKCVLFPKLLSLNLLRHNVLDGFMPYEKENSDPLPVDFLSTQFVHKSTCYLPTYVPLVSGIFGLVWTTMFLMCSSGSRSLSGLQRPWRVIVPVLVFSVAMSIICVYSSAVTHYGLQDLCLKLGGITGSTSCSYTVNVATLAYERQIRGVYQATRLTITSAWMHTACWVASSILAITRILMAVDFRLVKIRAELIGDLDRMLERNEEHVQTVMPSPWPQDRDSNGSRGSKVYSYFKNEHYDKVQEFGQLIDIGSDILFISEQPDPQSDQALLPEERNKSAKINAYESVKKEHRFIVNLVYDLIERLENECTSSSSPRTSSSIEVIARQFGQQIISSKTGHTYYSDHSDSPTSTEADEAAEEIKTAELKKLETRLIELPLQNSDDELKPGTSKMRGRISFESLPNLTHEIQKTLNGKSSKTLSIASSNRVRDKQNTKKSNLKAVVKDAAVQTEKKKSANKPKVTITEYKKSSSTDSKKDKNTQTNRKEKQD